MATQQSQLAQSMAEAALAFLEALTPAQRNKAQLDFADETERTNWHYIPRDRAGLPIKEMDQDQRQLAHTLVASGLSPTGAEKVKTIMSLEPILAQQEGSGRRFPRDPELYYVSIFGRPQTDDSWGWRFEGHHISLNNTVVGGNAIGTMPTFFGANPAEVRHGEQQGLRALKEEEDLGRELLFALDGEQRRQAIVNAEAPPDIITVNLPYIDGQVSPEGLAGSDMSADQRQLMQALVEVYIGRLPEAVAADQLARLAGAQLEHFHFAWAGAEERGGPHYYRVQSPQSLAEYDNTQNDANHIHAVWRDLSNDFGADLLRRHYQRDHR